MNESSFSDVKFAGKKKLTRRDRFLAQIDAATPRPALMAALLPHYFKGHGRENQPIRLERILRTYIPRYCFGPSGERIGNAVWLRNRPVARH